MTAPSTRKPPPCTSSASSVPGLLGCRRGLVLLRQGLRRPGACDPHSRRRRGHGSSGRLRKQGAPRGGIRRRHGHPGPSPFWPPPTARSMLTRTSPAKSGQPCPAPRPRASRLNSAPSRASSTSSERGQAGALRGSRTSCVLNAARRSHEKRKPDLETSAAAVSGKTTNASAMPLGDLPDEREPEARAASGGAALMKRLEDFFAVAFGDARSPVADRHPNLVFA